MIRSAVISVIGKLYVLGNLGLFQIVKTCKRKIIVEVYIAKASSFGPGRIVVYVLMYFEFSYNGILIEHSLQDQGL